MPHTVWSRTGVVYTDASPPTLASSVTSSDGRQIDVKQASYPQTPVKSRHGSANSSSFDMVEEFELGVFTQNGTLLAEAASCTNSPTKAANLVFRVAEKELTMKKFKSVVGFAASSVAEGVACSVNKVMEGKDAVEMLNSATDFVSSLPKIWRFQQGTSKPSTSLPQSRVISTPSLFHLGAKASRRHFITTMSAKARTALSDHGIMSAAQAAKLEFGVYRWQIEQALGGLYDYSQELFDGDALVEMAPSWIPDPEQKVWHLVLDTGIELEVSVDPWHLETGVELPERLCTMKIADYGRRSPNLEEDDWEDVESLLAEDEFEEMDGIRMMETVRVKKMEKQEGISTTERNPAKPQMAAKSSSCRDDTPIGIFRKFWSVS